MPHPAIRPSLITSITAGVIMLTGTAFLAGNALSQDGGGAVPITAPEDPGASPTLNMTPPNHDGKAVRLFATNDWSSWVDRDGEPSKWIVNARTRVVEVSGGDAITTQHFRDFQLHIEFRCPPMPDAAGQGRSNSGVYLHGRYEVQVLDTFGDPPASNIAGAIYNIAPPLVNAARPGGQWQTYDIIFRAPRFDLDGNVTELPRVTVIHNGIVVQNNLELPRTTPGGLGDDMVPEGPILLQDHGDPVQYRNIWVRPL